MTINPPPMNFRKRKRSEGKVSSAMGLKYLVLMRVLKQESE